MSKTEKRKNRRSLVFIYVILLLVLLTLLTVATYTWFSLSRTPRVSDMNMYITTREGLELSADPKSEEWVKQLDFRLIESVTAPLRPITWSQQQQRFVAALYGADGRLTGYNLWTPLSDDFNANRDDVYGYYIKSTFYVRTGVEMDVTLSPAVEVDEGINGSGTYVIGAPLWDAEAVSHNNGGQGAESAIRIGFRITEADANGEVAENAKSTFFIYEPNSDTHIDGSLGYVPTPSIDGAEQLIGSEYLIRQTASTWTETNPVKRNAVIKRLGEFTDTPVLFHIRPGQTIKIDLYVWLEGQDVDCTNQMNAAQIVANIQFAGDAGQQSGLVPIE